MSIYKIYKISNRLYKMKVPIIPKLIKIFLRVVFSCVIPYTAEIGDNTIFGYQGLGIVIHSRAIIGKNCIISQGVTLGGTSKKRGVPIIGDDVYIGSGAKIIGPIKVGNNVVIGANSVVITDIPSNCVVGGIPSRILKEGINISDYK